MRYHHEVLVSEEKVKGEREGGGKRPGRDNPLPCHSVSASVGVQKRKGIEKEKNVAKKEKGKGRRGRRGVDVSSFFAAKSRPRGEKAPP